MVHDGHGNPVFRLILRAQFFHSRLLVHSEYFLLPSCEKMKQDQKNTKEIFKPSTLWQDHLDNDHYEIYDSLKNNDVEKFLYY